ncbi:MAG: hypothetical protein H6716_25720 [Polyangiaceae bacterium]|nr:hypothetical protein [Polyangiaceae bacterium]
MHARFLSAAALGTALLWFTPATAQTLQVSDLQIARNVDISAYGPVGGATVGPDGSVYFLGANQASIYRVATDGSISLVVANIGRFAAGRSDIKIGRDNLLYALKTDAYPAEITRVALDGTVQPLLATIDDGGTSNAAGLDFDHQGNVYASDNRSYISVVTPAGQVSQVPIGISDIDEIEHGIDDSFFVTGSDDSSPSVTRMDHTGATSTFAVIPGKNPTAMALDFVTNTLYAAAERSSEVLRMRDANGNGSIEPATEVEVVLTGKAPLDVAYGPSSSGSGYSIYALDGTGLLELSGLATWDRDLGPRIDDDQDGYCESGIDQNGDGDCLDGGENTTNSDCDDADPTSFPNGTETCDGRDNDCDGSTDEDFPTLGDTCSSGIGACENSGFVVCSTDQLGVECDAVPGTPSAEICGNTADEDCDGTADECAGGTGGTGGSAGMGGTGGTSGGTGGGAIGGSGGDEQYDGGGIEADGGTARKKLDDDGCNCNLASNSNSRGAWLVVMGLAALLRRRYQLARGSGGPGFAKRKP